jgi:sorting nexin-1/2
VKTEVARFEQERIEDFKNSLHAFLEGMISRQKEVGAGAFWYGWSLTSLCQLITAWETYQQMLLKRVGGGGPVQVMPSSPSASTSS